MKLATDDSQPPPILIIGLTAGGAMDLPPHLITRIAEADLLVGGQRHLNYFPEFSGERFVIKANIQAVADRLQQAQAKSEKVVVLASGDPLCYGIGTTLRRYFPSSALEIIPAPSSFQLAFAALAESWQDATFLSAHARPFDEIIPDILAASKAALLTDSHQTPTLIAQTLLEIGFSPTTSCAICENLGGPDQRILRTQLAEVHQLSYAPLNVFVIWNEQSSQVQVPHPPGLPDESFSTSAHQITKREVRLLTLAELALGPGKIMWDIGAGSGAICIEAARAHPTAKIYAIEKRQELCHHLQKNLARFPAPNLHWSEGLAPAGVMDWPSPHAVFIGGSGGYLSEIIQLTCQRLRPGGRLVINLTTLENLHAARQHLPEAHLIQVQINRGVPILDQMVRFAALNPVYILTWQKATEDKVS